ncbi:CRISPR-associated helicase Cas3' [Saccharopolyspora sp. NPDC047091]|uniref:CRISPR-associated helicase Cas3' n=1 Tax=Saccharopolyspora sp. NPDC047091 TaxID=3155924 RepID=UPI0033EE1786
MADGLFATLTAAWGKEGRTGKPHPVICHLIDTAAVAELLFPVLLGPRARTDLERALAPLGDPVAWAAVLCGLHDLGKISPSFQVRCYDIAVGRLGPAAVPDLDRVVEATVPGRRRELTHDRVTAVHLGTRLAEWGAAAAGDVLAEVLGGHHGWVPDSDTRKESTRMRAHVGSAQWWRLRDATADRLAELWGLPPLAEAPWRETSWTLPAQIGLAGLTTVSDWIASDRKRFPWRPEVPDLDAYHRESRRIARELVDGFGWTRWRPERIGFTEMFGVRPRGLQRAVAQLVASRTRPGVLVIEAPTGEGKTKAGIQAAAALVRRLDLSGVYAAMPTRATIKSCYDEFNEVLARTGSPLRAVPAHGDGYQQVRAEHRCEPFDIGVDHEESWELRADAREWFARKHGVLAPVGVGTLDQALQAVVRSRHTFVQLTAMSGKVLLVDEVHSFTTYTSRLLERLLWWCGRLEIPVVLMSATLTARRRERLLAEWRAGARVEAVTGPEPVESGDGWQLNWVDAQERIPPVPLESDQQERQVQVVELERDDHCRWVLDELGERGAAMIVHSVVSQVTATADELRSLDPAAEVITLTGPDERRAETERRLHALLGPDGDCPGRVIVVGTSVLENLDLDVDALVTDLCPIDLLVQRLGRLHRRKPRGTAKVGLTELASARTAGRQEIRLPRATTHVHAPHLLQLTAGVLAGRTGITLPTDVGELVRAVYESSRETTALAKHEHTETKAHYHGEVVCVPRSDEDDALHDLTERPGSRTRTRSKNRRPEER